MSSWFCARYAYVYLALSARATPGPTVRSTRSDQHSNTQYLPLRLTIILRISSVAFIYLINIDFFAQVFRC